MDGILPTVSKPTFATNSKAKPLSSNGGIAQAKMKNRSYNNAAVEIELKSDSAQKIDNTFSISKSGGRQSTFGRLLKEITRMSSQIESLKEIKEKEPPNSEKQALINEEIDSLEESLKRMTSRYDERGKRTVFGEILDYVDSTINSFSAGAKSESILRAFSGSEVLLGAEFNELVRSGSVSNLKRLQGIGTSLSEAAQSSSTSALKNAAESIQSILNVSLGSEVEIVVEKEKEDVTTSNEAITVEQITFETSEEIALGMRTMPPDDMIRTISKGLEYDAKNILFLTQNKSAEEEKRDKNKEEILSY